LARPTKDSLPSSRLLLLQVFTRKGFLFKASGKD